MQEASSEQSRQFQFFEVHDFAKLIHPSHGNIGILIIPEMHRLIYFLLCIRTSRSINLLALSSYRKRTLHLERNEKRCMSSSASLVWDCNETTKASDYSKWKCVNFARDGERVFAEINRNLFHPCWIDFPANRCRQVECERKKKLKRNDYYSFLTNCDTCCMSQQFVSGRLLPSKWFIT